MDEIGLYLQSFRQGNIINQRSMKYMVHRGHKKLWHCCSTISMLDILSEQWWFNYSGSAEHWNRSQSFAQVADWNITLHQPLLSYRGIIKKLTSFTMLSVDNQLLEASLSASMKKMSLPDIKTISYEWLALTGFPPGISAPYSPSLQAVLSQHSCSPRAAPTTVVMPVLTFSLLCWALPCLEFSLSLSTAMSTMLFTNLRSMMAPIAEAREVETSRAWEIGNDFYKDFFFVNAETETEDWEINFKIQKSKLRVLHFLKLLNNSDFLPLAVIPSELQSELINLSSVENYLKLETISLLSILPVLPINLSQVIYIFRLGGSPSILTSLTALEISRLPARLRFKVSRKPRSSSCSMSIFLASLVSCSSGDSTCFPVRSERRLCPEPTTALVGRRKRRRERRETTSLIIRPAALHWPADTQSDLVWAQTTCDPDTLRISENITSLSN